MSRPILFAPHNDDETLFASFIVQRMNPLVVVCYRSKVQEANGITAEQREAETHAALWSLLGQPSKKQDLFTQWSWPDDSMHEKQIEACMWELAEASPSHVFAPAYHVKGHAQHNLVAELADLVFGTRNVTHYTTYQLGGPRHVGTTEIYPQEPSWIIRKLRALACYQSQITRGPSRMWLDFGLREWTA